MSGSHIRDLLVRLMCPLRRTIFDPVAIYDLLHQHHTRHEVGGADPITIPGLPLEGNYTTWTIQAIYDTGVAFCPIMAADMVGIRNDGRVVWHNAAAFTTYIISPAGGLLATLPDEQWLDATLKICFEYHSLTNRYLLLVDEAYTDIIVQEGLGEAWRRVVDNDKGIYTLNASPLTPLGGLSISPSGEWIVAMIKEAATDNGLIFIYRGS